jgi:UDP-N-acetylglucosamine 2-epimerase (hydrolysing)
MHKKVIFLTGTRADFGKMKSLILALNEHSTQFETHIFITGMHLEKEFGETYIEVEKFAKKNTFKVSNSSNGEMDIALSKTIKQFSNYVKNINPDLIVLHGDRLEPLAGAIVGAFNNFLVAHIEGGEVSGTIDEHIRHSISKLSHLHFVSNDASKKRLCQLGEDPNSIFVIGSPDLDIMVSKTLPSLKEAQRRYDINFKNYGIVLLHPVTTISSEENKYNSNILCDALLSTNEDCIVISPNNDHGHKEILTSFKNKLSTSQFRKFPSIRFEYFLTLLKNAKFIIGNSSAGIREAPFYGVPSINIGNRQKGRDKSTESIINCNFDEQEIIGSILQAKTKSFNPTKEFGEGNSANKFLEVLCKDYVWQKPVQKIFNDF